MSKAPCRSREGPSGFWLAGCRDWFRARASHDIPHLSLAEALSVVTLGLIRCYDASLLDFAGLSRISVDLERLLLYTYPLVAVLPEGQQ